VRASPLFRGRSRAPSSWPAPAVAPLAVFALIASCVPGVGATQGPQGPVRLSLPDATARALARNHDIAVQRESVALSEQAARRAEGAYDTLFRVEARGRTRTDPLNTIFSGAPEGAIGPRANSVSSSAGFSRLFSSGATASVSAGLSFDTTNNIFAVLSPSYFTSVAVDFRQPLLQGRRVDPARRAMRIAAVDRSRSTFALQRTAAETVAALERAYWTVAAARREVDVRRQAVALAEEQRVQTQVRLEAGAAAEADLAQPTAEIERRKGDVYAAEEALRRAQHALKQLMLDRADDPLWDADLQTDELPAAAFPAPIDARTAVTRALAQRPELAEITQALARQDIEIDVARERLRPALDIVASYSLRGLAGSANDGLRVPFPGVTVTIPDDLLGSLGQSYVNLAEHRFTDIGVGVQMSVPIGNRTAQADVASAEIARRQAELARDQLGQRIGAEVRNAIVALATAAQRIETARAGREAAEVQLQAERDRYDAGLTNDFFVLTRQNDLAVARLAETAALADYHRAATEYARAVGSILADRAITVEAPRPLEGR
jgi:HAE1 family hydrophobic/amphiphilic exporter-1